MTTEVPSSEPAHRVPFYFHYQSCNSHSSLLVAAGYVGTAIWMDIKNTIVLATAQHWQWLVGRPSVVRPWILGSSTRKNLPRQKYGRLLPA